MARKRTWTDEHRARYQATLEAKRAARQQSEQPPAVEQHTEQRAAAIAASIGNSTDVGDVEVTIRPGEQFRIAIAGIKLTVLARQL